MGLIIIPREYRLHGMTALSSGRQLDLIPDLPYLEGPEICSGDREAIVLYKILLSCYGADMMFVTTR